MRYASVIGAVALAVSCAGTAQATVYTSLTAFNTAAPTNSIFEDFESVTGGQLNTSLSVLVRPTATYRPAGGPNVYVSSAGFTNFGPGLNPTTSQILTASGNEDFTRTFVTAQAAFGMNVFLNDLGPATAYFYNGTTLVDSITFLADTNSTNNLQFAGVIAALPITSFRWTATLGGTLNTGVDNLRGVNVGALGAVPESSTWAMMLAGFALVGASLRRRSGRMVARLA